MTSKRVKSHHPDMERALNPNEKTVTVPKEVQFFTDYEGTSTHHPSAKLFSKPRYMPRQFKNLPSYFQLEPDVAPKNSTDEGCPKTCFSIEHHKFLNPMTPEDLLKKYYGDEEFPLGEEDDPPLHAYEKPWEVPNENEKNSVVNDGKSIQDGACEVNADEPAPPEYQANNVDRPKPKKTNRSGSGKKKSAKAKKKAAKAKKAKTAQSSTTANFNKNNNIPNSAEESPTASSASEGQELVPLPPPPPYEELEPLTDILIKIRIYKSFDNGDGTNNKGLLVMNNELSNDADSAKSNTYPWLPNHLNCPEYFKIVSGAALIAWYPAHLRFSYEYIQVDPMSTGLTCAHNVPAYLTSYCLMCYKKIMCDNEDDNTCQYNRPENKGDEGEMRSY